VERRWRRHRAAHRHSSATTVEALASAATTLLINKTASSVTASVNGTAVTLAGYQIATIPTPAT
jgi:hypothetical protein